MSALPKLKEGKPCKVYAAPVDVLVATLPGLTISFEQVFAAE